MAIKEITVIDRDEEERNLDDNMKLLKTREKTLTIY